MNKYDVCFEQAEKDLIQVLTEITRISNEETGELTEEAFTWAMKFCINAVRRQRGVNAAITFTAIAISSGFEIKTIDGQYKIDRWSEVFYQLDPYIIKAAKKVVNGKRKLRLNVTYHNYMGAA